MTVYQEPNKAERTVSVLVSLLILLWLLGGIAAFIMSIVCFGFKGTPTEKFLGLLLSIVTGPIYFIYLYISKTYCK
jgi:hypothetical protein